MNRTTVRKPALGYCALLCALLAIAAVLLMAFHVPAAFAAAGDKITVTGVIEWDDNKNAGDTRPEAVVVYLEDDEYNMLTTVRPDAIGNWVFSFNGVSEGAFEVSSEIDGYDVSVEIVGESGVRIVASLPNTTKPTLTITVRDQTYPYNGYPQGELDPVYDDPAVMAEKVIVEGLLPDDELTSLVMTGSQADVGEYPGAIEVTGFTINNNPGRADAYEVILVPGTLTITEPEPTETATLTFDLGGGTLDGKTGTITIEANVGDTITLPAAPTRDGYTFVCWKGSEYQAGAEYVVEGDHSFTAEWKADTNPVKPSDDNGDRTLPATGDDSSTMMLLSIACATLASLFLIAARRVN